MQTMLSACCNSQIELSWFVSLFRVHTMQRATMANSIMSHEPCGGQMLIIEDVCRPTGLLGYFRQGAGQVAKGCTTGLEFWLLTGINISHHFVLLSLPDGTMAAGLVSSFSIQKCGCFKNATLKLDQAIVPPHC